MKDHKLKVILFSTCDDTYDDIKIKSKDSAPGLSLMIFWTSKQFKAGVAEKTFANTLVNCWGCETVQERGICLWVVLCMTLVQGRQLQLFHILFFNEANEKF